MAKKSGRWRVKAVAAGAGSLVDLAGKATYRSTHRRTYRAAKSDWHAIGDDFAVAVDTCKPDDQPSHR